MKYVIALSLLIAVFCTLLLAIDGTMRNAASDAALHEIHFVFGDQVTARVLSVDRIGRGLDGTHLRVKAAVLVPGEPQESLWYCETRFNGDGWLVGLERVAAFPRERP